MDCEDFTRDDFIRFAEAYNIYTYHICYAEFDSEFYEEAIVFFTDTEEALRTLEYIHNLNVVCGHIDISD